MGDSYIVLPLTAHKDLPAWLESEGVVVPSIPVDNRNPTPAEIRPVLNSLEGYQVRYSIGPEKWDAEIEAVDSNSNPMWACIWVSNFDGDESHSHEFHFHKGWPELNLLITRRLSEVCGPLVLISASGATPVLVTPEMR